jgi:VWFA-related protein
VRAAFLVGFFAAALLAQDSAPFRSNVEIAVVPCAVVDATGAPVTDLTRDEFRVYDNDVRRPIQNFSFDTDLPLTLGVIIDASESQNPQLPEHRLTAADLLDRILRPGDRAFVITVDGNSRLTVDVTGASSELRNHLAGGSGDLLGEPCAMRQSNVPGLGPWPGCGASPLWNAIYDAARIKLQPLAGNKALLMLTDGFDSGSTHTWNQAADAVNHAEASLYAIQYRSGTGASFAPDLFRLITGTGGTRFRAPGGDYGPILSRIETDLRRRYVIGFRPERASGKIKHDVRIEVTRPNLAVRARKTYFRDSP